jgi:hypothetical protein
MPRPDEPRYIIYRHAGRSLCEGCAPVTDKSTYTLWVLISIARQRGWTHCEQCGRPFTPVEDTPNG